MKGGIHFAVYTASRSTVCCKQLHLRNADFIGTLASLFTRVNRDLQKIVNIFRTVYSFKPA